MREGKAKLLDDETSTWANIWLVLSMADEGNNDSAIVLTAKQDDKVFFPLFDVALVLSGFAGGRGACLCGD